MVMYRKDLMEAPGLTMPDAPTWADIEKADAAAMTNRDAEINGVCLRGKAGWGENMAFLTAMSNSFGARWFDENWKPQFDQPEWKATLDFYLNLMNNYGPPGASNNGFNENLTLFNQGKCGMWIDATVAASFVTGKDSTVADKVGFALAPDNGLGKRGNWLWAWSLAIPASSDARMRPRPSSTGQRPRTIWRSSPPRKAGPTFLRERGPRSMRTRNTRRCRSPR
jgi:sorbitol/mannitol transport system substrate-binding protein